MDSTVLSNGSVVEMESVRLPDGEMVKEFDLPSGTARVRVAHVPPFLLFFLVKSRSDLEDIPIPLVKVKGGIGEKWLPAREGQVEYNEWEKAQDERERARGDAQEDVYWDYAVAQWRLLDSDTDAWMSKPPTGWKVSTRMKKMGVKPRTSTLGRRLDYIRYILAVTNFDVEIIQDVMFGMTSPVTEAEKEQVARLFQVHPDGEGDTASPAESQ